MHNKADVDMIKLLLATVEQMEKDSSEGSRISVSWLVEKVRGYLEERRGDGPIRCDAINDLPAPLQVLFRSADISGLPFLRVEEVDEDGRVDRALNFCSEWCLIMHYVRGKGMQILPVEDPLAAVN